jgi:methylisocitrate lyase
MQMIFAEALYPLEDHRAFTRAVPIPVLANITEFGKTPLFTVGELRGVGVVLYPLSAFRAMSAAGNDMEDRDSKGVVDQMQTREQLYDVLNYHSFEDKLDQLFSKNQKV